MNTYRVTLTSPGHRETIKLLATSSKDAEQTARKAAGNPPEAQATTKEVNYTPTCTAPQTMGALPEKYIVLEAWEYHDKEFGNSYFSGRARVNEGKGVLEFRVKFQYGYERHYETVLESALIASGFLQPDQTAYNYCKDNGFQYFSFKTTGLTEVQARNLGL